MNTKPGMTVVLLMALMLVSMANAATVWNPAGNGISPPATGDWNTAANWTNGLPSTDPLAVGAKAVFNVLNSAECVVSNVQSFYQFVQGDNGPGEVIRVTAGGSLITGVVWSAVGYNNTAHMIVETGGSVSLAEHLWIGFTGSSVGTLDLEGGTVNVAGMFALGWSGGIGYANINDGTLNLSNFTAASIGDSSIMDIELGTVVIDGDIRPIIEPMISPIFPPGGGRITAYDGTGTVHYDYNITNPGKTTIWAEPDSVNLGMGDVDGDGDVDTTDLSLFAAQWRKVPPDPRADFTGDQQVNMADFGILAANWLHNQYSRTLTGKMMCGYQGWFNCPDDGSGRGWVHWGKSARFEPGYCSVDLWPDMSEYDADEKFPTVFQYADTSTAQVFSSYNEKTVLRHFSWMAEYGIDGIFLQRFATETTPGSAARNHRDQVMLNCREGGNLYKRAWAMMYDLSGLASGSDIQKVVNDWKHLVDTYQISQDPTDSAYLHHNGKPVVAVWGLGFGRSYEGQESYELIHFLKNDPTYGGCTVMLGVDDDWRTNLDSWFQQTVLLADIISPWAVGRYGSIYTSELDNYTNNVTVPDKAWCDTNSKEYLPVVFPGFSWQNLTGEKWDHIPRRGGSFLWRQIYKAIAQGGATMIYQAMFDEVDEGTAIFKCTNTPPVAEEPDVFPSTPFLPTGNVDYPPYDPSDALLPSDHYLWLVGQAGRMLRGEIEPTANIPLRENQ